MTVELLPWANHDAAAKRIVPALKAALPCLGAAALDAACLRQAVAQVGRTAFRRPLAADELAFYADAALGAQKEIGPQLALEIGVEALLSSPHAVFRVELGGGAPDTTGRLRLTPHQTASALAFSLTHAPPDNALAAAADAGALGSPEQVRMHVLRLLGGPGWSAVSDRFFREYLPYSAATSVHKNAKTYPGHNAAALVADTAAFIQDLLAQRRGFLRGLLTSGSGFVDSATAPSYGARVPAMTAIKSSASLLED